MARSIILGLPGIDVVFSAEERVLEFHESRLKNAGNHPRPQDEALMVLDGEAALMCAAALWVAHRRQCAQRWLVDWLREVERAANSTHAAEVNRFYRQGRRMLRRPA